MSVKLNIDAQFIGTEKQNPEGIYLEVKGKTVGECLGQYLDSKPLLTIDFFDKAGKLGPTTFVFVNRAPLISGQLDREVKDGDEVKIIYSPMRGC
jgi:hypothetical protein